MKPRLIVVVVAAILITLASLARAEKAAPPRADFLITVQATGTGVLLSCEKGCAWRDLSFDCGDKLPCGSQIDEFGMVDAAE